MRPRWHVEIKFFAAAALLISLLGLLQVRETSSQDDGIENDFDLNLTEDEDDGINFFERRQTLPGRPISASQPANPSGCNFKPPIQCSNSRYRSMDGRCNNLNRVEAGSSFSNMVRMSRPAYNDGVNTPRGGYNSEQLPNPRLLSTQVHPDFIRSFPPATTMVNNFGQFVVHDISLTAVNANPLSCCGRDRSTNADCIPIDIPPNDPFYSRLSPPRTCLDVRRSSLLCPQSRREQFTGTTSFLDLSTLYGPGGRQTSAVRAFTGGRLLMDSGGMLPPASSGLFITGDIRSNTIAGLDVIHTIWLREHNRIASALSQIFSGQSDEFLFQETRRIVIAEYQNVVYNELLPTMLGRSAAIEFDLLSTAPSTYDRNADPSIINECVTAALRFGHSLLNGNIELWRGNTRASTVQLRNTFLNDGLVRSNFDLFVDGFLRQVIQRPDPFITEDVSNFLFKPPNAPFGDDLTSRDIQRGRDHGIAGYTTYRSVCGGNQISGWGNKPNEIPQASWDMLRRTYATPDDIDLFTGGLMENTRDGLTGPVNVCIIGTQFSNLKSGDRYFFTHTNNANQFSSAELAAIRSRKFSDIVCDNTGVATAQNNAFSVASNSNPMIACSRRQKLNMNAFAPRSG